MMIQVSVTGGTQRRAGGAKYIRMHLKFSAICCIPLTHLYILRLLNDDSFIFLKYFRLSQMTCLFTKNTQNYFLEA